MEVKNLSQGSAVLTSNAYLVLGKSNALVDAGSDPLILERVRDCLDDLESIYLTHMHSDHVGNLDEFKKTFDPEVHGFASSPEVDSKLEDGERVTFGGLTFQALHTPGHEENHLCFFGDGILFSGDLIFPGGSFGRTDIAGADRGDLISSIEKISKLDVRAMYPGHGNPVTFEVNNQISRSLRNAKLLFG